MGNNHPNYTPRNRSTSPIPERRPISKSTTRKASLSPINRKSTKKSITNSDINPNDLFEGSENNFLGMKRSSVSKNQVIQILIYFLAVLRTEYNLNRSKMESLLEEELRR